MNTSYRWLIALSFILSTTINAQNNISDFTLESSSINELQISSLFIKTDNSLTWTQQNEITQRHNTFTIESINGAWDETNNIGKLTINLSLNNYKTVLILSGDAKGVSASLRLIDDTRTENKVFNFPINYITYN